MRSSPTASAASTPTRASSSARSQPCPRGRRPDMAQPAESRSARVQRLLHEADELKRDGRYMDSERRYRTAVRLHPDNLTALFRLGCLLSAMNRPAEAAKFLNRALATNPPDPEVKAQLEEALRKLESHPQ